MTACRQRSDIASVYAVKWWVRTFAFFCSLVLLNACSFHLRSGGHYQDDGPHPLPVDVSGIPDAEPKREPRSPYGNDPYTVHGQVYYPLSHAEGYRERGIASWYGRKFHGRRTASGDIYDMYAMTAAHCTLPLPSYVRVRNLQNGRLVIVRINDRGPFLHNRLIDLSYAAAVKLGIVASGTGIVEIEAINPDSPPTQLATPGAGTGGDGPKPPSEGASETIAARQKPAISLISTARAATSSATVRLFVQLGAFMQWDNASALRDRLERAAFTPIQVQSVLLENQQRLYRVRVGPLKSVEEADRLVEKANQYGLYNAVIVVEE